MEVEETMETDQEVNAMINKFSILQTEDKEHLIAELQRLVGGTKGGETPLDVTNYATAHFLLEMSNWNLNLAIGNFFDLLQDGCHGYSMKLIFFETKTRSYGNPNFELIQTENNIENNSIAITPNTKFLISFKLLNDGITDWGPLCYFKFCENGQKMTNLNPLPLDNPPVVPQEIREVAMELLSPPNEGKFPVQIKLCSHHHNQIGELLTFDLVVKGNDLASQFLSLNVTETTENLQLS